MPEDEEVGTTETDEATEIDNTADDSEETADPAENLKKALRAERLARRDAERRARELEQERENANKEPAEAAIDSARREGAAEATRRAHERILRSEIRSAAKGRLADPADAFAYLNLDEFEVGDDGDVDSDAIEDAISELLTRKPYLGVDKGDKFRPVDQGARDKDVKPSQLSKAELENLSPADLMRAFNEGRVDQLLGRKP